MLLGNLSKLHGDFLKRNFYTLNGGPAASSARGAATATRQSAGWVSGGSGALAALVAAALAKMEWRYDNGQNGDSKEEEETPGKDKGSG